MTGRDDADRRYASPPGMAGEIAADWFDPLGVDPQQARDVAGWRKAERAQLRALRDAMGAADRRAASGALDRALRALLACRFDGMAGRVFSGYWPIKGEPDLRPLLAALAAEGARVALPVVETKAAPLVFRRWTPETRMIRGDWNIPIPPPEAERLAPQIALAPLVGWDGAGYRLGYGGGYFDRTLAALAPRPFAIGVGYEAARLATIHPQPHDIPLDAVVTEAGVRFDRDRP